MSNDEEISPGLAPARERGPATSPAQSSKAEASGVNRTTDLSFDGLGEPVKHRVATLPNPQEDLERLLVPAPEIVGRRRTLAEARASLEREADAIQNVRLGRAHPLYFDYLRHAHDLVASEAERLGNQLSLGAEETLEGWARGYLARVHEVAGSASRAPAMPDGPVGYQRPDVIGALNEVEAQAAARAARRAAHVCLGVAPDHPVVVTLRRSSGSECLDRIAINAFQTAALARPVAPDIRPGLACYLVAVSAYRMPPLPSLSLGWKNGRPELVSPLKRIDRVTVELESVDFGAPAGPSSLLRRPN